jgi:hypothetical protein
MSILRDAYELQGTRGLQKALHQSSVAQLDREELKGESWLRYGDHIMIFRERESEERSKQDRTRVFAAGSGFLDDSVEAQGIRYDSGEKSYDFESMLLDARWRDKLFKVVPRLKLECAWDLKIHMEQLYHAQKGTVEDLR